MSSICHQKLDIAPFHGDLNSHGGPHMNRTKHDSTAQFVRTVIEHGGPDRIWTFADFAVTDRGALAAALSRLARTGLLTRVRRGVYYRAKPTLFGPSKPDPKALANAVAKARGETSVPSGVAEYSRLGLTHQTAAALTRATVRRSARENIGGLRVDSKVRPLSAQKGISPEERTALDALRDINRIPDASPATVLRRLAMLIRSGDLKFRRLAQHAMSEPPRVRALLGALGDEIRRAGGENQVPAETLGWLQQSLNPLTNFEVAGVRDVLARSADGWRIK